MQTPDQTGNTAAITDLRDRWEQLKDVDRAVAVYKIHEAGTSFRCLAQDLNCSESLLRQLNNAAQAPALDRILARRKKISTRELVRRGRSEKELQAKTARESLERQRKQDSEKVCDAISDFLAREDWSPQYGEQLIDEARRYLAFAEAAQLVPKDPFPPLCLPLVEVLKRLWPPSDSDDATDFNIRAECLVKFVVAALPDSMSRHRALQLALQTQIARPNPSRQVGTPH
jgi:hypothetical protein